jgi:glycopeptide antibiotics resistance protein
MRRFTAVVATLAAVALVLWLTVGPPARVRAFSELIAPVRGVAGGAAHELLNVALFLPVGLAGALLARGRWLLPALAALPFLVEAVQFWMQRRNASGRDLAMNLLGLAAGWAIGRVLARALGR